MKVKLKVETPMGLLSYLRAYHPSYPSVKALKRAIDQKQCRVNGCVERFSTHLLKPGDRIEIALTDPPQVIPLAVLYENEEFIAYNKSPYLVSHPPEEYLIVHRLDKETSGVLIFAKDAKSQEKLSRLFAKRQVSKTYLALVDGKVEKENWTCVHYLGKKESYEGGAIYGPVSPSVGKKAITEFHLLRASQEASLVLCLPVTGRTHQIRAHLKISGHPILGDWHYARSFKCAYQPKRHLLHAYKLVISDVPITAPLFEDFKEAYAKIFQDPHCENICDWGCPASFPNNR